MCNWFQNNSPTNTFAVDWDTWHCNWAGQCYFDGASPTGSSRWCYCLQRHLACEGLYKDYRVHIFRNISIHAIYSDIPFHFNHWTTGSFFFKILSYNVPCKYNIIYIYIYIKTCQNFRNGLCVKYLNGKVVLHRLLGSFLKHIFNMTTDDHLEFWCLGSSK